MVFCLKPKLSKLNDPYGLVFIFVRVHGPSWSDGRWPFRCPQNFRVKKKWNVQGLRGRQCLMKPGLNHI